MINSNFKNAVKTILCTTMIVGVMCLTPITAKATEIVVTPVQANFTVKANTVVYATADITTPTPCVLPEDFPIAITGITNTGFWEIEINNVKFYLVGDAVKTTAAPVKKAPAVVTTGMKNAVKKAKSYIKLMGFSRTGLIGQLKYEGFTDEESEYGADYCGADWNKESIEKAQSYIKISGFSRTGLIGQLKYEGFTDAESVYGADNCGANWFAECGEKAQSYMRLTGFSRQGLINQLQYEGFTDAEIAYGLTAVGY